jgi:hypothetical protein
MRKLLILVITAISVLTFESCNLKRINTNNVIKQDITIEGKIVEIKNGKDGYMATLESNDGKEYIAIISILNLNKGEYKNYSVGDRIKVNGSYWINSDDKVNIVVKKIIRSKRTD